jgi:hypothetical protein
MRPPTAAELLTIWDDFPTESSHVRLEQLLAHALPDEAIDADTLGTRNQRLIVLHEALIGGRIEAIATCSTCGMANEFDVPTNAIAAAPAPDRDARAAIEWDGSHVTARLPTMADIASVCGIQAEAARAALIARCAGEELPDEAAELLGAAFETLDPAAAVRLSTTCAGCERPLNIDVDVAAFVEKAIERRIAVHFAEIDMIARAYGWSEAEILALSSARRARYAAMVADDVPRWRA